MTRKQLEDMGLTKEQVDKIMDINGADIEAAKGELTAVTTERDSLKTQVADRDKQIETLKASAGDNEELTKQIEQLQAENKATKVNAAVEMALTRANAKNVRAVKALLENLDTAEIGDDGKVKGLDDQITKLKSGEDTKFLFAEEKGKAPKMKGVTPADGGDGKPSSMTKADFLKLSSKDQMAYIKDHPDWQTELK